MLSATPTHTHACTLFLSRPYIHTDTHTLTCVRGTNGAWGPLSLLPMLRIERKREGKRAGDRRGGPGACVPVCDYKSHPLVNEAIHHSLLGTGVEGV